MNRLPIIAILLLILAQTASAQRYGGYNNNDYQKFRIGLQGGWSYRTAKIDDAVPKDYREYLKKLKSGYHYGANAIFFFNRSIGVGIEYSGYRAKNEADIWMTDTATFKLVTGKLKDDITLSFIGPSFSSRYIFGANDNFHLIGTVSIGYLSYKNNATQFYDFVNTGATVGVLTGLSFDIALQEHIFLGAGVSYLSGLLSKIEYKDAKSSNTIKLEENNKIGLSRVDVSAGIRFNF